jgi:ureidoacrylate peracid hydrolase
MHNYVIPQAVKDRVIRRQGKLFGHDTIDAARTALVVVDMQNYFVAEGFAAEVPAARGIVPNINRMAGALRAAGGTVVWIQTTAKGALETWGNHHKHQLTPERVKNRLTQLDEAHDGFKVFPGLDVAPGDMRIKKVKYSAFIGDRRTSTPSSRAAASTRC